MMRNASEVREQATALHALVERCAPGTPRKVRKDVASYYELESVFWEAHPRYFFYDFFLAAPERTLDAGYARKLADSLRLSTPLPDGLAVVGPPAYPTGRVSYQLAYRTGRGEDDGPIEAIWSNTERLTYSSYLQYLTHCALKWMSGHAVVRCTIVKLDIVPPRLAFPALSQRVFDGGDGVLGLPVSGELDRDEPASHGRYRIVAPSREALTRWLETHPWKRDWEVIIPEFLRGKIAPSDLGIVTADRNATANEQTAAKKKRATANEQTTARRSARPRKNKNGRDEGGPGEA